MASLGAEVVGVPVDDQGLVVEDDYDSEFRYGGRPIEPLQTLDPRGRVIYVGSFSKALLATLRLGFLVAPASLVAAVRSAKFLAHWHTPLLTQAALADFIDQGLFARHLRRMRAVTSSDTGGSWRRWTTGSPTT
jgi:GntR family transcriptional regulator/MocR family aminotransferase